MTDYELALKSLEEIEKGIGHLYWQPTFFGENISTVKSALIQAEKEHKSLGTIDQEKGLPIPVYIALLENEAGVSYGPRFYVKGRRQRGAKQSIELVEVLKTDFSCRKVSFTVFLKNYPFSEYGKTWARTREELEK